MENSVSTDPSIYTYDLKKWRISKKHSQGHILVSVLDVFPVNSFTYVLTIVQSIYKAYHLILHLIKYLNFKGHSYTFYKRIKKPKVYVK